MKRKKAVESDEEEDMELEGEDKEEDGELQEVDWTEPTQVHDLQRPGEDLTMLWFVGQIAGLMEKDLTE